MDKDKQTILFRHLAGSKLYGTNLPTSDTDYKEVYIPSPREILLGQTSKAGQSSTGSSKGKNTAEDEDVTRMSLQKFLQLCANGDVGCIETLFADVNAAAVIYQHDLWGVVLQARQQLTNRSIYKSMGYMRSQVNRYVVRGTRADAVKNILNILEGHPKGDRLESIRGEIEAGIKGFEFSAIEAGKDGLHLTVCNRKSPMRNKIGDSYDIYKKLDDEYGARTKAAQNLNGLDWKGIQHCLRIGSQMVELLKEGKITFPRDNSAYLKKVRQGEIDVDEVMPQIDALFQEIETLGVEGDKTPSMQAAEDISLRLHETTLEAYFAAKT